MPEKKNNRTLMTWVNSVRVKQAIAMQPLICQASTHGSSKQPGKLDHRAANACHLIQVLARKMAHAPKPGVRRSAATIMDTCYPTHLQLTWMSGFSESTVRRTLSDLVEWGFITVAHEPGLSGHIRCRYRIVPELWEWTPPEGDLEDGTTVQPARLPKQKKGTRPATPASVLAADQAIVDSLDAIAPDADPPGHSTQAELDSVEEIHGFLEETVGQHPTYKRSDAMPIIVDCVDHCVSMAGDPGLCLRVMQAALGNAGIRTSVLGSKMVGGYIKTSFSGWLAKYSGVGAAGTSGTRVETAAAPGRSHLPASGSNDAQEPIADQLSPDLELAKILARHSGSPVDPKRFAYAVETSDVELAQWAVHNKPWADQLATDPKPSDYFFLMADEIAAAMSLSSAG